MKAMDDPEQYSMQEYYNRRAPEYEEKYLRNDPARQTEQVAIAECIHEVFAGRIVLEVACGTGYWTEVVARVARHVTATDASAEMLAIAAGKDIPPGKVDFQYADAYNLRAVSGEFDAGLSNFWFSHIRHTDITRFFNGLHNRLGQGAVVFMCDDMYNPGVGGELVRYQADEDTYKRRQLWDGSQYMIVKNYYDVTSLRSVFGPYADDLQINVGTYYWWLRYSVVCT